MLSNVSFTADAIFSFTTKTECFMFLQIRLLVLEKYFTQKIFIPWHDFPLWNILLFVVIHRILWPGVVKLQTWRTAATNANVGHLHQNNEGTDVQWIMSVTFRWFICFYCMEKNHLNSFRFILQMRVNLLPTASFVVLPRTRSRVETNVNMFYSKKQRLNGYLAWPYQLLWIICYGNQRFAQHSNHVNVNECFTAQPETKTLQPQILYQL